MRTSPHVVPRMVLELLAWPYAAAVWIRNRAFDLGLLKTTAVSVPVISVGNLTVGGTGKTPLVEYIVRYCLSRGKRVAVVSRGYARNSRGIVIVSDGQSLRVSAAEGGDEPVQIAKKFPGVVVVVGERRVGASKVAIGQYGAEVIVLDDGFQHRYLRRDLDVVVVGSRGPLRSDTMLPAGRMREPWAGIRRAHVVALSKVDPGGADSSPVLDIVRRCYDGPIILVRHKIDCVCSALSGVRVEQKEMNRRPVLAVSGIADPESFVEDLNALGFTVRGSLVFPDHHTYVFSDVQQIAQTMRRCGAEACVTTEKDAVRMNADSCVIDNLLRVHDVYYTCISSEVLRGEMEFLSMIDSCVEKRYRS